MKKVARYISVVMVMGLLFSCDQDRDNIPSVEERKAAATQKLLDELTAPTAGWRLDYKPTSNAGTFLILMEFNEDGTVRIQSDVPDNDGEFRDQTIPFRIDHDLATELVLETYGVFHYLFELNQNTFGAEFEFLYQGKAEDNLVFRSKTDFNDITTLVFQPAQPFDQDLISTEIINQLRSSGYRQDDLSGISPQSMFQIYVPSDNVSIYANVDASNRKINFLGAAVGNSMDEVINSSTKTSLNQTIDLAFINEAIIFDRALDFNLGGASYSFTGLTPSNFQSEDSSYCAGQNMISHTSFDVEMEGLGNGQMQSTLFSSHENFLDEEDEFYVVNYPFVFDENDSSLAEDFEEAFENVAVFVVILNSAPRGYPGDSFTGVGFAGFDVNNRVQFFLREMNITAQSGNYVQLELTDGTYINVADSLDERDALFALTDEIFSGGEIYASTLFSLDQEGIFEVYNPCNDYKFILLE